MAYLLLFFKALGLTIAIECGIAAALQKFGGPWFFFSPKYSLLLPIVALASMLTLPYVWFVLPELIKPRLAYELVSEAGVTVVEGVWYMLALRINLKKALILSVCANLGSVLIGKLFF
jgi:hypothetical protein